MSDSGPEIDPAGLDDVAVGRPALTTILEALEAMLPLWEVGDRHRNYVRVAVWYRRHRHHDAARVAAERARASLALARAVTAARRALGGDAVAVLLAENLRPGDAVVDLGEVRSVRSVNAATVAVTFAGGRVSTFARDEVLTLTCM